jgi:hypothetical protein
MSNFIELINDDGEKEKIEILATFHLDEDEYAVLRYPDSEEGMIYRVEKNNGQPVFIMIDDDEELEEVIQIYEGMADDLI